MATSVTPSRGQRLERDARRIARAARWILARRSEDRARRAPPAPRRRHARSPRRSRVARARARPPAHGRSAGRPASGCSTFGSAECMRLPCPAARIATLRGEVTGDVRGKTVMIRQPACRPCAARRQRVQRRPAGDTVLREDRPTRPRTKRAPFAIEHRRIPCSSTRRCAALAVLFAAATLSAPLRAADACTNRGELDSMYCDANKDMVADVPTDPKKWKNPSTIVFTYTPVEDPAVYENIFKPFTTHLAQVPRQEGRLLPGAVERRGDRGDALGPPACRRLFDRAHRVRRQSRRRGAVRGQGHREGVPGLQPHRHRQGELAVPEARRSRRARRSRTRRRRRTRATSRRWRCSRRRASRRTRTTRSSSPASTTSR